MKIAFLLGSARIGGGTYVVVQHALHAQSCGHDVTLLLPHAPSPADIAWHPGLASLKLQVLSEFGDSPVDLAVATFWRTALELPRVRARQYAYFVQSIESLFYTPDQVAMRTLVDQTYGLGLPGITEASWIQRHLADHHGGRYLLAHNGIRKDVYTAEGPTIAAQQKKGLRVLIEGPLQSARIKNTARTVRTVRRSGRFETWLLTSTRLRWYPGVDRLFSAVPIQDVAPIYRSCDVIVKLSLIEGMFGPPLEMFHCGGTAIVYDVSGHDEYIRDQHNALVAPMHDEARVIEHLQALRDDLPLLLRLKAGARETALAWPGWPESSAVFLRHMEAIVEATPVPRERLAADVTAIRAEFAEQFRASAAKPGRFERAAWLQRGKHALNAGRQWLGYVADGYREAPP